VQEEATPIVKLVEKINLTSPTITSIDVEGFFKKIQDMKETFDEVDDHFNEFI